MAANIVSLQDSSLFCENNDKTRLKQFTFFILSLWRDWRIFCPHHARSDRHVLCHIQTQVGLKKQGVMDFDETYNDQNDEGDVEFVRVVLILEPFGDL